MPYAERCDSAVACDSGGVFSIMSCVVFGCAAAFCLPAMFDDNEPHIAVTPNLFRSLPCYKNITFIKLFDVNSNRGLLRYTCLHLTESITAHAAAVMFRCEERILSHTIQSISYATLLLRAINTSRLPFATTKSTKCCF